MGNLKLSRYLINYDDDCTRFITKLYAVKCFIKNMYIYIYFYRIEKFFQRSAYFASIVDIKQQELN